MNALALAARASAKLQRVALRRAEKFRWQSIYARYCDATMIPRQAYLDNLAIAARVANDRTLLNCSVVECGTWRGGMAAGLMEIMGNHRAYHFFDSFSGLPPAKDIDGKSALQWQADKAAPTYFDNCTASEDEFRATILRVASAPSRCSVHKGLFQDTVGKSDTGSIAILRIDGDWYDSTMTCLDALFPRVALGGVLIIDDYGTWDGCTRALHDYLAAHKRPEAIERFGSSAVPHLKIRSI